MTSSSFPQSVALLTDMVSTEPIAVKQEVIAVAEGGHESKVEANVPAPAKPAPKFTAPKSVARPTPTPKPASADPKPPSAVKAKVEADKPAA